MEPIKVDPDIVISDLIEAYPEVAEFLIMEYAIHCVGCFANQFDTLRNGASIHGIDGEYFDEMMVGINDKVNEVYGQEQTKKTKK